MDWDEEVDVVCTGAGLGGLASAIAAVDAGGDVFVATSTRGEGAYAHAIADRPQVDHLRHWLGVDVLDSETKEYFAAVSSDLVPLSRWAGEVDVPVRVVDEPTPAELSRHAVEPFVGARLRDWAATCLTSPYGYHYTRASLRGSTTMRSRDGGAIQVIEVGSFESGALEFQGSALTDWLGARARDRCIEIHAASPLQRIVFEDGEVVGAVVATPDGPYAVRARHGVAVAPGGPLVSTVTRHELLAGHATARLCLVSRTASRFGRLELLTTEPLAQRPASTCRPTNRRLHASLHETRQPHSQPLRCGKVHGYPPLGQ